MLQKLKDMWASVKAWFLNSETIFLNRVEAVTGLVIAAVAAMDWSPLWSVFGTGTALNTKELASISGFLVVRGIVGEIARRRNTVVTPANTLATVGT